MHTPRHNQIAHREQFAADTLETASNARVVTLCFDRLDRDLAGARIAIERHDHFTTNEALGHAQDLLAEMAAMLDLEAWSDARSLLAIYDYLLRLLETANVHKADAMVVEAQTIVREIGDAFRAAARVAGSASVLPSAGSADADHGLGSPSWSVTA